MKKIILIITLLFAFSIQAQNKQITGKVSSATDGSKLPGVTVKVSGSTKNYSTDFDGAFTLNAELGATLSFSYIGFKNKTVVIESNIISVKLTEEAENLKEVVVGALGVKKSKASLGYATQSVTGQEIQDTQRPNFINGLQGRVAGLQVITSSGAPGASTSIQLRGVNSLSGSNSPLFIVDGLPINNETLSQGLLISDQPNRQQDYTNRAADINPDDIENITVLKGPEAAALYGIAAGNGAIVITTKKGTKGAGNITYSNNTRLENIYLFPKVQDTYQQGFDGINSTNYRRHFGTPYASGTQKFNNVGNFFRMGVSQQHNLTFDGGSENATYRLSLANLNQKGVVPNSTYDRLNLSLNGTVKISEKFKSEAFLAYTKSSNRKASKGAGGFLTTLLAFPANLDVRQYTNSDGSRKRITDGTIDTEVDNPFWDVNKNLNEDFNNRFVANVSLIYDPVKWLNLTARVGFDVSAGQGYRAVHPESQLGIGQLGYIESYLNNNSNTNANIFATIKKSFGKFNTRFLIGNSVDDRYQRIFSSQGNKFFDANFNSINNTDATTQRSQERIIQKRLFGLFGDFTVDYDRILYLTLTGRNDWSSTLPVGKNSFQSYSTSASFVFTELEALKDNSFLTYGKLRASNASTARDPDAYAIDAIFQPVLTTGGGYAYGVTGGNPDLKPEFLKSTEIGIELKFLKGRLGLDVAAYRKTTDDLLIKNIRLSYGTGFIITNLNTGSSKNEGLEITLTGSPIKTANFEWSTKINFEKTRSELLSLPPSLPEYYVSDTWALGNVRGGIRVGTPLTTLTGWTYLRNNAGDVLIDPASGSPLKDQTFPIIGDRNPDFVIGYQNTFNYKNFAFSFLLDIRKGGDVFNGNEYFLYQQGLSTRTLDRETPRIIKGVFRDGLENTANPTQNNIQITPYYQNNYYRFDLVESDFVEKNINWLRMRDLTMSYKFSSKVLARTKFFKSIQLNFTMTDLFMITNYTGADPAVNVNNASTGGANGTGYDYGSLSTPRSFNLGFKIGI